MNQTKINELKYLGQRAKTMLDGLTFYLTEKEGVVSISIQLGNKKLNITNNFNYELGNVMFNYIETFKNGNDKSNGFREWGMTEENIRPRIMEWLEKQLENNGDKEIILFCLNN